MLEFLRMLLAGVGATLIIFALVFVTLLVGGLVNAMAALMSGPLVDRALGETPAERAEG
jgi:hypothetical protein